MTNSSDNRDEASKTPGQAQSPAPAQQNQGGAQNTNQPKPADKPQQK